MKSRYCFTILFACLCIVPFAQTETEPNNNCNDANTLEWEGQITGQINPQADPDYYELTLPNVGVLNARVFTTAGSSELSFDLRLRDSSCETIKTEGWSDDVELKKRICTPGTYYLLVEDHFNRSSDSLYTLQVSFDQRDTCECNDDFDTAKEVFFGSATTGTILDEGDIDFFKFEVTQTAIIEARVFTTLSEGLSFDIGLYDSNFERLVGEGFSKDEKLKYRVCEPGIYYIKIEEHFGRCNQALYTFQLDIDLRDANECNDDFLTATPMDLASSTTGTIRHEEDKDFFQLDIEQLGLLDIRVFTLGDGLSFDLFLYNDSFQQLDVEGWSPDESITYMITEPGTYYVRVQDHFGRCSDAVYTLFTNLTPTVAINEIHISPIVVSPNPASSEIAITWPAELIPKENFQLQIYNKTGYLIKSIGLKARNSQIISIEELSSGMYYIQLKVKDQYFWQRFVKL